MRQTRSGEPRSVDTVRRRDGRGGGFTLIEVVMVMAVLAVAGAVLTPAVGRTVDGIRVRTEVAGIASFLRWAREQAVTRGEPNEVALDLKAHALVFRRAGGEPGARGETRRPLSPLLQVAAASAPRVTFLPQGRSSGASFRIEAVGPRVYFVTVDPLTGRVAARRADS